MEVHKETIARVPFVTKLILSAKGREFEPVLVIESMIDAGEIVPEV